MNLNSHKPCTYQLCICNQWQISENSPAIPPSKIISLYLLSLSPCSGNFGHIHAIFAWISSLKYLLLAGSRPAKLLLLLFGLLYCWVSIWLTFWIFLDLILFSRVGKVTTTATSQLQTCVFCNHEARMHPLAVLLSSPSKSCSPRQCRSAALCSLDDIKQWNE